MKILIMKKEYLKKDLTCWSKFHIFVRANIDTRLLSKSYFNCGVDKNYFQKIIIFWQNITLFGNPSCNIFNYCLSHREMVSPAGFEPATHSLKGNCSTYWAKGPYKDNVYIVQIILRQELMRMYSLNLKT